MGWLDVLSAVKSNIDELEQEYLSGFDFIPAHHQVFRALPPDPSAAKVLIIGQDPYPNPSNAMGLAFSYPANQQLPASLRNIFQELHSDLNQPLRVDGNLSDWQEQGVVLLNRVLTTSPGISNAHQKIGWQKITESICIAMAAHGTLAILWGRAAQELAPLFDQADIKMSAHPSPLSAYRGFFGSRPFSFINARLQDKGQTQIDWG
ncbi:MAG: uracil-DNA glycosylase [Actinomycetes bacterium]